MPHEGHGKCLPEGKFSTEKFVPVQLYSDILVGITVVVVGVSLCLGRRKEGECH